MGNLTEYKSRFRILKGGENISNNFGTGDRKYNDFRIP